MQSLIQSPFHPAFVHFPIALYLLGCLMTALYLWQKKADFERFAYWSFMLSWLAAVVASVVGLIDKGQLDFDDPRQNALNQHITPAIIFMVVNGLLLYSRFRWPDVLDSSRRWWYLALMAAGIILIIATGHLGGELVYTLKIGVR